MSIILLHLTNMQNQYIYRCSPVEILHTILLGPIKYLLQSFIPSLSEREKKEVLSWITAIGPSGIEGKVHGNICYYYNSFVGRDFKAWAQIAPMVAGPFLSQDKKDVWVAVSKVLHIYTYTGP